MALNKKKQKKSKPVKKSTKKPTAKKPVKKTAAKKAKSVKAVIKKVAPKTKKAVSTKKVADKKPTLKVVQKLNVSFSPLYDHVLIRQDGESDRTPGGLYIPAIAQDRPARGKVVAIGSGRKSKKGVLRPLDVKVGENVIYNHYSGSKITIEGSEYLILKESDVLGVVRD